MQNTGHADLVRTEDGGWAAVYLAVRPRGYTPSFHVLGRETFLAGVDWMDGWPVFDEGRFAVPPADTSFVDDFSASRLDVRWVVPGGEPEAVGARRAAGGFELRPSADGSAGLLCVRVRDLAWRAEAVVEGSGRFVVLIDDRHWYGLTFDDGRVTATARVGDLVHDVDAAPVGGSVLTLRIEAVEPTSASGPDEVVLSFKDGDGFRELGRLDGRYLSTEVAAGFTGRVLGVGAVGGAPAVVRRVEYAPA